MLPNFVTTVGHKDNIPTTRHKVAIITSLDAATFLFGKRRCPPILYNHLTSATDSMSVSIEALMYEIPPTNFWLSFEAEPVMIKCQSGASVWISLDRAGNDTVFHYNDVIMCAMASQISGVSIVYSTVRSGADQRKNQSSASLALCAENSPVTGDFPAQRANDAENVTIGWRHHAVRLISSTLVRLLVSQTRHRTFETKSCDTSVILDISGNLLTAIDGNGYVILSHTL